ncbi:uncharacterized protein LOC143296879 isoform X2 [Babylonia areolata]|uniref:uncharacterized protein LOC143296879 isoform X2 n=1 Tax=Babylonia areolata TaxID=304850 RepID=UPI003FCFD576
MLQPSYRAAERLALSPPSLHAGPSRPARVDTPPETHRANERLAPSPSSLHTQPSRPARVDTPPTESKARWKLYIRIPSFRLPRVSLKRVPFCLRKIIAGTVTPRGQLPKHA